MTDNANTASKDGVAAQHPVLSKFIRQWKLFRFCTPVLCLCWGGAIGYLVASDNHFHMSRDYLWTIIFVEVGAITIAVLPFAWSALIRKYANILHCSICTFSLPVGGQAILINNLRGIDLAVIATAIGLSLLFWYPSFRMLTLEKEITLFKAEDYERLEEEEMEVAPGWDETPKNRPK